MRSSACPWTAAGLLPAAVVLLLTGPAGCLDYGFPDDPPGSVCIDRDFERLDGSSGADVLYAAMYSDGSTASVRIYTGVTVEDGIEWDLRHVWVPAFDGYPVPMPGNSILVLYLNDDGSAVLSFVDDLETYEGRVGIHLRIDLRTGEVVESWSD